MCGGNFGPITWSGAALPKGVLPIAVFIRVETRLVRTVIRQRRRCPLGALLIQVKDKLSILPGGYQDDAESLWACNKSPLTRWHPAVSAVPFEHADANAHRDHVDPDRVPDGGQKAQIHGRKRPKSLQFRTCCETFSTRDPSCTFAELKIRIIKSFLGNSNSNVPH